ncbi:MAG TPA: glycosyltransferase family A protein [Bacteroidales bacterium]|nr:glycosyltransferase family A protein [Bacteroidales bacterium]
MDVPLFSVVITTYNRAELLKRALDSLVLQTEKNWEAIIVDDESTDNTYTEVLPYLESYPAISYLKKEHSGEPLSKNAGIFYASGKYVTFLDSDDEYAPEHLELRREILTGDASLSFLHGGVKVIGNPMVPDRFDPEKSVPLSECVIGGTFFIGREILYELGGFRDIYLGADADLLDRALNKGINIKKTAYPTYIYHHEVEDSITNMLFSDNNTGNT